MKKYLKIFYIAICMVICLIPFAGMTFWATDSTTENKVLASFPSLFDEDGLNLSFPEELGTYFEDHFAFREALVNADAEIMARVFGVSNADTVTLGTDGWLYYTATVDDYLGQDLMSERAIYNAAHNLKLTQDYVEASGAQFLVAVVPNKNSLYGDNMPYYDSVIVSDESNWENLSAAMDQLDVSYADLFTLFKSTDEVLYLKRDSHWNNKGALLAYNYLTDCLGLSVENYETTSVVRTKTEIGDLGSMLFPLTAESEWNYYYEFEPDAAYSYVTDTASVEDTWIITKNTSRDGSVLLFRDSFGNTLLPFFAGAFGDAYFSRSETYTVGRYLATYAPEVVILERVERNLDSFATTPPMLQTIALGEDTSDAAGSAAEVSDDTTSDTAANSDDGFASGTDAADSANETDPALTGASATDSDAAGTGSDALLNAAAASEAAANTTTCTFASASDILYYTVSGTLDEAFCQTETEIYIRLTCGENTVLFPAFYVSSDTSDYGYQLYLEKDYLSGFASDGGSLTLEVLTETDDTWLIMAVKEITLS